MQPPIRRSVRVPDADARRPVRGVLQRVFAPRDPDHPDRDPCRRWTDVHDPERLDLRMAPRHLTLAAPWGAT